MRPWLSLEKLLIDLLPALFEEAFTDRFTKVVKSMVSAWPSRSEERRVGKEC